MSFKKYASDSWNGLDNDPGKVVSILLIKCYCGSGGSLDSQ
jgi:hypothetical protein